MQSKLLKYLFLYFAKYTTENGGEDGIVRSISGKEETTVIITIVVIDREKRAIVQDCAHSATFSKSDVHVPSSLQSSYNKDLINILWCVNNQVRKLHSECVTTRINFENLLEAIVSFFWIFRLNKHVRETRWRRLYYTGNRYVRSSDHGVEEMISKISGNYQNFQSSGGSSGIVPATLRRVGRFNVICNKVTPADLYAIPFEDLTWENFTHWNR